MKPALLLALSPLLLSACVETGATDGALVGSGTKLTMAEKVTMFDEAVASIGCDLQFESDYLPVELQTGMTREEIQQVAARQVRRGNAVAIADGGVRLSSGPCADGATPTALAPAAAVAG